MTEKDRSRREFICPDSRFYRGFEDWRYTILAERLFWVINNGGDLQNIWQKDIWGCWAYMIIVRVPIILFLPSRYERRRGRQGARTSREKWSRKVDNYFFFPPSSSSVCTISSSAILVQGTYQSLRIFWLGSWQILTPRTSTPSEPRPELILHALDTYYITRHVKKSIITFQFSLLCNEKAVAKDCTHAFWSLQQILTVERLPGILGAPGWRNKVKTNKMQKFSKKKSSLNITLILILSLKLFNLRDDTWGGSYLMKVMNSLLQ